MIAGDSSDIQPGEPWALLEPVCGGIIKQLKMMAAMVLAAAVAVSAAAPVAVRRACCETRFFIA
jgi:hypothetical protein